MKKISLLLAIVLVCTIVFSACSCSMEEDTIPDVTPTQPIETSPTPEPDIDPDVEDEGLGENSPKPDDGIDDSGTAIPDDVPMD